MSEDAPEQGRSKGLGSFIRGLAVVVVSYLAAAIAYWYPEKVPSFVGPSVYVWFSLGAGTLLLCMVLFTHERWLRAVLE